jgi:hypothetical protein
MRQLPDILNDKINVVGGKAALGRLLGVTGEGILQYTQGKMPSLKIAINWKIAFNENLIDLIFADEQVPQVAEPAPGYENLKDKLIATQEALIECQQENARLKNKGQNPEDHEKGS